MPKTAGEAGPLRRMWRSRRVRRLTTVLAVVALAVLLVFLFVLPPLVGSVARRALADLGIEDVELNVRSVGPGSAEIGEVTAGAAGDASIGRIVIRYDVFDLLAGRVDEILLENPRLRVGLDADGIDWRALRPLFEREKAPSAEPLPFDRILIADGVVVVDAWGETIAIDVAGRVERSADRALDLDLELLAYGERAELEGGVDLVSRRLDLALVAEVEEIAALVRRIPRELATRRPLVSGPLTLSAGVSGAFDAPRVRVDLETPGLEVRGDTPFGDFAFQNLAIELHAEGTSAWSDASARFRGVAGAGSALGERIERATIEVALEDRALKVAVALDGAGWSIGELGFDGTLDLAPDAPAMLDGTVAATATGRPPWALRRRFGIDMPLVDDATPRLELDGHVLLRRHGEAVAASVSRATALIALPAVAANAVGVAVKDLALDVPELRGLWSDGALTLVIGAGTTATAGGLRIENGTSSAEEAADALRLELVEDAWIALPAQAGRSLVRARGVTMSAHVARARARAMEARDLDVEAAFAVQIEGDGSAVLRLDPGSTMQVGFLDPRLSRLVLEPADAPLLTLEVEEEPLTLRIAPQGSRPWQLMARRLHVGAALERVEDLILDLEVAAPRLDLDVGVVATPNGLAVGLLVDEGHAAEASWSGITLAAAGESLAVSPGSMALAPRDEASVLAWTFGGARDVSAALSAATRTEMRFSLSGRESRFSADAEIGAALSWKEAGLDVLIEAALGDLAGELVWPITEGAVTAVATDADVRAWYRLEPGATGRAGFAASGEQGVIELTLARGDGPEPDWSGSGVLAALDGEVVMTQPPSVSALLAFDAGRFRHEGLDLTVRDISADLPIVMGEAARPRDDGTLTYRALGMGADELPGMTGTISLRERTLRFGGTSAILPDAKVEITGMIDFATGLPIGSIEAVLPPFRFDETNAPGDVFAMASGAEVEGEMSFTARIDVDRRAWTSNLELSLKDVDVTSLEWDLDLEDLDADVVIDDLRAMTTPPHQSISVRRARLGEIELADGTVEFQTESATKVFIERTDWTWAGGSVSAFAAAFDRETVSGELELFVTGIDLGRFLEIVTADKASGTGRLDGRLPLNVAWPEITFGSGQLYARPGGGEVLFSEEKTVRDLLGGENLDPVREGAVRALRHLRYEVLTADVVQEEGETLAKFRVRGKPADSSSQQEYVVDVNIRGLDRLVNSLIIVQRARKGLEESGLSLETGSDPP